MSHGASDRAARPTRAPSVRSGPRVHVRRRQGSRQHASNRDEIALLQSTSQCWGERLGPDIGGG
jgi:hypothetical protein